MRYRTLEEALQSINTDEHFAKWMPLSCLVSDEERLIVKDYIESKNGATEQDVTMLAMSIKWKRESKDMTLFDLIEEHRGHA